MIDKLQKAVENNVLPLSKLKKLNYPLFKYVCKNLNRISTSLKENFEIEILDDVKSLRDKDKIRLYIKYHFGNIVNLSDLRENHRTIYNYITRYGKPRDVLENMGFKIKYDCSLSEDQLIEELKTLADENGRIKKIGSNLYYRVYYRATKSGYNVKEYIESLGFSMNYIDLPTLLKLRNEEGKSFSEIAKILGHPVSTIYNKYKEYKGYGGTVVYITKCPVCQQDLEYGMYCKEHGNICPVCLEPLEDGYVCSGCSCMYHDGCVDKTKGFFELRRENLCPVCKELPSIFEKEEVREKCHSHYLKTLN